MAAATNDKRGIFRVLLVQIPLVVSHESPLPHLFHKMGAGINKRKKINFTFVIRHRKKLHGLLLHFCGPS